MKLGLGGCNEFEMITEFNLEEHGMDFRKTGHWERCKQVWN